MLFKSLPESIPFLKFQDFYLQAEDAGQPFTEAGCISSVDQDGAPHARYVNFKYFFEDNLIFFSSYTRNKALDFDKNQNSINWQIVLVLLNLNYSYFVFIYYSV